jgi:hypothetical protein
MAVTGEIAEEVRATLPVSWDALIEDARYGESFFQRRIDQTKKSVFGEILDPRFRDYNI